MPSTITKKNFHNKNTAKFSRKLYNQNWSDIYNKTDAQCAFYFAKSCRSAHRGCIPRADFNSDLQNKAPMVKCRVESRKSRNSLANLCKQNPNDKKIHMKYKRDGNLETAQLRNAHIAYQSNESDIVKKRHFKVL